MKFILFALCLLWGYLSHAQVKEKYISNSKFSGFATSTTLVHDGNRIIVGTTIGADKSENAFISCIASSDSILWSKEIGTANNDRFLAVSPTSDSGCVVVGYFDQTLGTPYKDTKAAVYKFDKTGTVLWSYVYEATVWGEYFRSVVEMPGSKNIICAGMTNYGTGTLNNGLLVNLSSSGTLNWAKKYVTSAKSEIMDIAEYKGNIICTGLYTGTTYYDGFLFSAKESNGALNWGRSFDYVSYNNPLCTTQWCEQVQIVNDKIYVDAYLSPPWGTTTSKDFVTPTILSFDSAGLSPTCLEWPISGKRWSNVLHSKVVSDTEIYLFQHADNVQWSKTYSNTSMTGGSDVVCTRIRSLTYSAGFMVFSRSFANPGQQTIVATDYQAGKLIGFGGSFGDPSNLIGIQDIFKFESDGSLPVTATSCVENKTGQLFGNPSVKMNTSFAFSSISDVTLTNPVTPTVTPVVYTWIDPCKIVLPNDIDPGFYFTRTGCFTYQFTDTTKTKFSGIKYWNWYFGDGGTASVKNPLHTYTSAGTYLVKLVVTDSLGEKDSVTQTLIIIPYKFLTVSNDTTLCAKETAHKLILHASGGKTFRWTPSSGLSDSTSANPIATVASNIHYTVVATDSLGCEDVDSVFIKIITVDVSATPNTIAGCEGKEVRLKASGALSYQWDPPTGLDDDKIAEPLLIISGSKIYTVTGTDAFGCTDKDSLYVTQTPRPIITILPDPVEGCIGKEIELSVSGAVLYQWEPSEGLDKSNIPNPVMTLSGITRYIVTGTDSNGCIAKDSLDIHVFPAPKVNAVSDFYTIDCNRSSVTLSASGALSYSWTPAIYCENNFAAITKATPPHSKVFTVWGTDANGCIGEDTVGIVFTGQSLVKVPNAFTPNLDGMNDNIKPIIVCDFELTSFSIYGRWGEQIYTTNSISNPWDGNYNGRPCEVGVYYYLVKGRNAAGEEVLLKGDITLIR